MRIQWLFATVVLAGFFSGCSATKEVITVDAVKVDPPAIPGYVAMTVPADNPMTQAKIDLGKQLYYDKRLSGDGSRACYSCHL